jgi:hypothetical protein
MALNYIRQPATGTRQPKSIALPAADCRMPDSGSICVRFRLLIV